jgi:AcrR family transcriptional regulator
MMEQVPVRDGRKERRIAAMRRVQQVALDAFEAKGWAGVTVDDVARAAGVGVASVFRNFGTKEGLVLWDEYDPELFAHVERHLAAGAPPRRAMLHAVVDALADVYARDKARILRRADLIMATPELAAASHLGVRALRDALDQLLAKHGFGRRLERAVTAATLAATLEVGVEEWRRRRGRVSLEKVLREAFADEGVPQRR